MSDLPSLNQTMDEGCRSRLFFSRTCETFSFSRHRVMVLSTMSDSPSFRWKAPQHPSVVGGFFWLFLVNVATHIPGFCLCPVSAARCPEIHHSKPLPSPAVVPAFPRFFSPPLQICQMTLPYTGFSPLLEENVLRPPFVSPLRISMA